MNTDDVIKDLQYSIRPDVRGYAAKILGCTKDKNGLKPLINAAMKDPDKYVRETAILALAQYRDPEAVEPLLKALVFSKSQDIVEAAGDALGLIQDERAVDPVFTLFKMTNDPEILATCIWVLGAMKVEGAKTTLCEILFREKNRFIKELAARALVKFNDEGIFNLLTDGLFNGRDQAYRLTAAAALYEYPDGRGRPFFIRCLHDNPDTEVRLKAAGYLMKSGWKPETKIERVYYTIAMRNWNEVKGFGTLAIKPAEHIFSLTISGNIHFQKELANVITELYYKITCIIFDRDSGEPADTYSEFLNPDSKAMKIPLNNLKKIIIKSENHNPMEIEKFVTYAINHMDENLLKDRIEVEIRGDRSKIKPNLLNLLKSHFKSVQ